MLCHLLVLAYNGNSTTEIKAVKRLIYSKNLISVWVMTEKFATAKFFTQASSAGVINKCAAIFNSWLKNPHGPSYIQSIKNNDIHLWCRNREATCWCLSIYVSQIISMQSGSVLFIYLRFNIAFNTILWAEETSVYRWSRFCTANCQPLVTEIFCDIESRVWTADLGGGRWLTVAKSVEVLHSFFFVLIVFISAYYKCTYHLIQSHLEQAINDLI